MGSFKNAEHQAWQSPRSVIGLSLFTCDVIGLHSILEPHMLHVGALSSQSAWDGTPVLPVSLIVVAAL